MENSSNFSELSKTNKIWAIGSLHSSLESFQSIKKYILSNFELGDKLVFLGNLIGFRAESKKIIDEVLIEIGEVDISQMGKVIGAVMSKGEGIDGAVVSRLVKEKLT